MVGVGNLYHAKLIDHFNGYLLQSTTEPLKETQLPILMRMTEPARCWMKALKMFSTRTAVSLSHFDLVCFFSCLIWGLVLFMRVSALTLYHLS